MMGWMEWGRREITLSLLTVSPDDGADALFKEKDTERDKKRKGDKIASGPMGVSPLPESCGGRRGGPVWERKTLYCLLVYTYYTFLHCF